MNIGTEPMARPKKSAPPPNPSASAEDRMTIINLKGSLAYVDWLEAVHKKTRISKAVIIRIAVEEWAKNNGHDAPPEI